MNNLVEIRDGNAVTTSLAVADGTENEHASVIRLIRTYLHDFDEFGRVGFEIAPFQTPGGVQQREIAVLNEQHATLLLTYMKNGGIVRAFKKRLVHEFYKLAHQARSAVPTGLPNFLDPAAAAIAWAEQHKLREAAESEAKKLEAVTHEQAAAIEQAKPKVQFYDTFRNADGLYGLDNTARALNIPPRRFTRALYDQGYLFREGGVLVPYAIHRDKGIFYVKVTLVDDTARQQTFITPKGLTYFAKRFADLIVQPQLDLAS